MGNTNETTAEEEERRVSSYSSSQSHSEGIKVEEKGMAKVNAELEKGTTSTPYFDVNATPLFAKFGVERANLKWENLTLNIGSKEILKKVNGHVDAGSVTAILGPSGAGKSSLLNILAGRILNKGKKRITGAVTVNGQLIRPASYRKRIAYVMQQDSLFATATCREALMFSANLRLGKSVSKELKQGMVDELIESLGLTGCANTLIGSELVRGISGGEKKRVAIGVELVTNPSTLFLDEPTSGLDSYSAYNTVNILKALAANGCSILCTVHQPSSEIFGLFDNVILMSSGFCVYNGPLQELPAQFELGGYPIPPLTNPADHVMMLMQTKAREELPQYNVDVPESDEVKAWGAAAKGVGFKRNASVWTQSVHLMKREILNLGRDKGALIGRFVITSILNLLFAAIFYQVGDVNKSDYDINSHFGAIVNIYITGLFGASQPPLLTFPLERVVFMREYSTGSYGALPYLLSKLLVEIPLNGFQALLVLVISYFLMGLVGNFFFHVCSLWLIQLACASYAYLIGALVPDAKAAQEIAPAILVPQLLFAGFFISINQVPELLQWVQYVCALKFAINLGSIIEFEDICNDANASAATTFSCQQRIFEANDVDPDLSWLYILILLMIFVLFRTLSLLALMWRAQNYTN